MNIKSRILTPLKDLWSYRMEPEKMRLLALVYWRSLLAVAVCIAVGTITIAIQELDLVVQAQEPPATQRSSAGPMLDHVQLDATLAQYAARAAQYQGLASSSIQVIPDPSK